MDDNITQNSQINAENFKILNQNLLQPMPSLLAASIYNNDQIDNDDDDCREDSSKSITNLSMKHEEEFTNQIFGIKEANHMKTEGYCEYCRRNFCNKYYLKRHKLEVHGVHCGSDKSGWKKMKSKDKLLKDKCVAGTPGGNLKNFFPILDENRIQKTPDFNFDNSMFYFDHTKDLMKNPTRNSFHIDSLNVTSANSVLDKTSSINIKSNWSNLSSISNNNSNSNSNNDSSLKSNLPCPYCFQTFTKSHLVMHHMLVSHTEFMKDFMNFLNCHQQQNGGKIWPNNSGLLFNHNNSASSNLLQFFYGQLINNSVGPNGQLAGLGFGPNSGPINDRVKCDVCMKDICNKYYLKLHKQRMHSSNNNENSGNFSDTNEFKLKNLVNDEFYDCRSNPLNLDGEKMADSLNFEHSFCIDLCMKNLSTYNKANGYFNHGLSNNTKLDSVLDDKILPKPNYRIRPMENKINHKESPASEISHDNEDNVVDVISDCHSENDICEINYSQDSQNSSFLPLDLSLKFESPINLFNKKSKPNSIKPKLKHILKRSKQSTCYRYQKLKQWKYICAKITQSSQLSPPSQKSQTFIVKELFPFSNCHKELNNKIIQSDSEKTQYVFGNKLITLPVTNMFKNSPYSLILQPIFD